MPRRLRWFLSMASIVLAAFAYDLWRHPNVFAGFEIAQIHAMVLCWWLSVVAVVSGLVFGGSRAESIWPVAVAAAVILLPPAQTVLAFTLRSIRGFSP
jgi:hypothetical protein